MGNSASYPIEAVVQISPVEYYRCPYQMKPRAAQAVGAINRYYRNQGKRVILLAPGRLGTSSPELGVPVAFAEISGFSVLCEVSDSRAGYMPELSYGSHMFQDLVEADILYCASGTISGRFGTRRINLRSWRICFRKSARIRKNCFPCSGSRSQKDCGSGMMW